MDKEKIFYSCLLIVVNIIFSLISTQVFLHHDMLYIHSLELLLFILGILIWVTIGAPLIISILRENE
jgi:hypothetical protein